MSVSQLPSTSLPPSTQAPFQIQQMNTNLCVDTEFGEKGNFPILLPCSGSLSQQFNLKNVGDLDDGSGYNAYLVQPVYNETLCFGEQVYAAGGFPGLQVDLWPCFSNDIRNQLWLLKPGQSTAFTLPFPIYNVCLDGSSGNAVSLLPCNETKSQLFTATSLSR